MSWSQSAAVAWFGVVMLAVGFLIGATERRKTNRRKHESARLPHRFRNVFDRHYRAWK